MKTCDWCGKELPKNKKRFCCNKHKDQYHNHHNPRGIYAHLNPKNKDCDAFIEVESDIHPFSEEALQP